MSRKLVTVQELAEICGLHVQTIYNWVAQGKIPFHRFGKRTLRFDVDEVNDWSRKKGSKGRIRDGVVNQY